MNDYGWFFQSLVGSVPYVLVYLLGLVFAIVNWSRWPKASLLTCLGAVLLLVSTLLGHAFSLWLIQAQHGGGRMGPQLGQLLAIVRAILGAGGIALILVAVFADRDSAPRAIQAEMIPPKPKF